MQRNMSLSDSNKQALAVWMKLSSSSSVRVQCIKCHIKSDLATILSHKWNVGNVSFHELFKTNEHINQILHTLGNDLFVTVLLLLLYECECCNKLLLFITSSIPSVITWTHLHPLFSFETNCKRSWSVLNIFKITCALAHIIYSSGNNLVDETKLAGKLFSMLMALHTPTIKH